jgi:hypothetical protein
MSKASCRRIYRNSPRVFRNYVRTFAMQSRVLTNDPSLVKALDPSLIPLCRKFANGYVKAGSLLIGPEMWTAQRRYFPKIAGRFVRNSDDPNDGFATPEEAILAGRRYRAGCRAYFAVEVKQGVSNV